MHQSESRFKRRWRSHALNADHLTYQLNLFNGLKASMTRPTKPAQTRLLNYSATLCVVVSSMVGPGGFTSLGAQAAQVPDAAALIILWIFGGFIALCGALSYSELAAALPRSGGEYFYLSRIFHPHLGKLAGWVSATAGFAAPVALSAMAAGHYANTFLPVEPTAFALGTIALVGIAHAIDVKAGGTFQVVMTSMKVLLIFGFCLAGLVFTDIPKTQSIQLTGHSVQAVFSDRFALSLIYVYYAYSGWNSAVYVAAEVKNPQRNVPRALIHGTLLVTFLYVLLNLTFLHTIPILDMVGTVEVGALSARAIFGGQGEVMLSALLCLILLSSTSAMVMTGSRVLCAIGEDQPRLGFLAIRNRHDAPTHAVLVQQVLAAALVCTQSFEGVLTLAGFILSLFSLITVCGVFRLRRCEPKLPRPFKVPLYPLPPLIFIAANAYGILSVVTERPMTALLGLGVLGIGWLIIAKLH